VGACVSAPSVVCGLFSVLYGTICGTPYRGKSDHLGGWVRPLGVHRCGGGLGGLTGYCTLHTSSRSVSSLDGLPLSNKVFLNRIYKILYPRNNLTLLLTVWRLLVILASPCIWVRFLALSWRWLCFGAAPSLFLLTLVWTFCRVALSTSSDNAKWARHTPLNPVTRYARIKPPHLRIQPSVPLLEIKRGVGIQRNSGKREG